MSWNTTNPPKRKVKPVKLRYQNPLGRIHQGKFVWSDEEGAWMEVSDGPDGGRLYKEDGWKVLGWKK